MATLIYNVTDLQNMANNLAGDYELANDIDASATSGWNGGLGLAPIGGPGTPFTGSLDGKAYTISDLHINRPSEPQVGLFGICYGATIENLKFDSPHISGKRKVGVLSGDFAATAKEIHVTGGYLEGGNEGYHIGGLFGQIGNGAQVESSDYQGEVRADSASDVGGFVGNIYGGLGHVKYCSADVTLVVTASTNRPYSIGGFAGGITPYTGWRRVYECYSVGSITVSKYGPAYPPLSVGGFAGLAYNYADLDDCYSRVIVTTDSGVRVGGFIGELKFYVRVDNVYSTGSVSGAAGLGGLIGKNTDPDKCFVYDSFWDTETSGQATSDGGTGKTTEEMKTEATFTDAGWDFVVIWSIHPDYNNGYPILQQIPPPLLVAGYIWIEDTEFAYLDANRVKRVEEGTLDGATGQTAGHLWVEGDNLRYIDSSGSERYIAGSQEGATGKTAGHIWIEATKFRYIDSSGNERCFEGTT